MASKHEKTIYDPAPLFFFSWGELYGGQSAVCLIVRDDCYLPEWRSGHHSRGDAKNKRASCKHELDDYSRLWNGLSYRGVTFCGEKKKAKRTNKEVLSVAASLIRETVVESRLPCTGSVQTDRDRLGPSREDHSWAAAGGLEEPSAVEAPGC